MKDTKCIEYKSDFIFLSNSYNNINDLDVQNIEEYLLKYYNETKNGNDLEVDKNNFLISLTNTYNQNNNI